MRRISPHSPLRVVIPADDAPEARHLLQTGRDALAFYYQQFALSLRAPLLTVVVHERDLSVPFSAVADNMVFLARDLVRVPALAHKFPEFVLARGLAQQWWGLRTAYNLRTERWVGEDWPRTWPRVGWNIPMVVAGHLSPGKLPGFPICHFGNSISTFPIAYWSLTV